MSVPLTIQGVTFQYPQQGDNNWGPTLTNWSTAVTNAIMPLLTGGSIQVGPYPGATVNFANSTNTGYLPLAINGSNQLTFNGNVVNTLTLPITVSEGGTGDTSFTPYSVVCGGMTSTGDLQNVAGVGLVNQALTSNGPGFLPSWQNVAGSGTVNTGTAGEIAYYASSSNVLSGLPVLTYSAPTLTLQPNSGNSQLFLISNSGASAIIRLTGNNIFSTTLDCAADGSFSINDIDNSVTIFDYTRAGGGLVTLSTPLAMSAKKITGLANGSASTDATAFGQLTSGNTITAGGIANATITTTQIATGTVTGSTANSGGSEGNIDQGTISTPDLRANAVTNITGSNSGSTTTSGYTSLTTITLTTIGGPVLLLGSAVVTLNGTTNTFDAHLAITRSGQTSNIPGALSNWAGTDSSQISPNMGQTVNVLGFDNPPAGTWTYTLGYSAVGAITSIGSPYSLVGTEFRA